MLSRFFNTDFKERHSFHILKAACEHVFTRCSFNKHLETTKSPFYSSCPLASKFRDVYSKSCFVKLREKVNSYNFYILYTVGWYPSVLGLQKGKNSSCGKL